MQNYYLLTLVKSVLNGFEMVISWFMHVIFIVMHFLLMFQTRFYFYIFSFHFNLLF